VQFPSTSNMGRHAQNRPIAVPGARHVTALRALSTLKERDPHHAAVNQHWGDLPVERAGGMPDSVGSIGSLLKQFERWAIRLHPRAEPRIGLTPGDRRSVGSHASWQFRQKDELFLRSPEKYQGIVVVRDGETADRVDVKWITDIGEPIQTRQP